MKITEYNFNRWRHNHHFFKLSKDFYHHRELFYETLNEEIILEALSYTWVNTSSLKWFSDSVYLMGLMTYEIELAIKLQELPIEEETIDHPYYNNNNDKL